MLRGWGEITTSARTCDVPVSRCQQCCQSYDEKIPIWLSRFEFPSYIRQCCGMIHTHRKYNAVGINGCNRRGGEVQVSVLCCKDKWDMFRGRRAMPANTEKEVNCEGKCLGVKPIYMTYWGLAEVSFQVEPRVDYELQVIYTAIGVWGLFREVTWVGFIAFLL